MGEKETVWVYSGTG